MCRSLSVGESGRVHRLTECQPIRANAGTLVSRMRRTTRHGPAAGPTVQQGQRERGGPCRLVLSGARVSRTATNAEALRPRPVHERSRKRSDVAQRNGWAKVP